MRIISDAQGPRTPDLRKTAERYIGDGLAVIPIPACSKNPDRRGWQSLRLGAEDVPHYFATSGQNIGILTGEPSGGLVDVDLDVPEAVAVGRRLLPGTLKSGRESSPNSHYWYRCDPIPETAKFQVPRNDEGPEMFVELRSTGKQTVVEPSIHPEGDRYEWGGGKLLEIPGPELLERVREVATAALLVRHWPSRGRHEFTLAAAGYLGRKLTPGRVEAILEAAAFAAGDEEWRDRARAVADTLENLASGVPVTGGPTLDQLAPGVPRILARWWERGARAPSWRSAPPSTNGHRPKEVAFDPKDARGLTAALAEAITDEHHFARDAGGKLYVYEGGAYRPEGERIIAVAIKRLLEGGGSQAMWTTHRAREVTEYIRVDAPELWERPPVSRINVLNGILDAETRQLSEHAPDFLSPVQLPVRFDPDVTCPAWEKFVAETFPEDAQDLAFEIPAWLMTPDTSIQKAILLLGEGANGKS
ncbi:MAG: bifunctional DNA primase/polymerase, partial [Actinomycetota bacterium]|nr:bifunctional DNA primase/polymerase [Actinomycetota bacterium]